MNNINWIPPDLTLVSKAALELLKEDVKRLKRSNTALANHVERLADMFEQMREKCSQITEITKQLVPLDAFESLAAAIHMSYEDDSRDAILSRLRTALLEAARDRIPEVVINSLHGVASIEVYRLIALRRSELGGCHPQFVDQLGRLLPGAKLAERKALPRHRPDFFVDLPDCNGVPVEIKAGAFDKKAVIQLARYMRVYESERGIAVARKLTAPLHSGMTFVMLQERLGDGLDMTLRNGKAK